MDFCTSDNLLSILIAIVIIAPFQEWILFFYENLIKITVLMYRDVWILYDRVGR